MRALNEMNDKTKDKIKKPNSSFWLLAAHHFSKVWKLLLESLTALGEAFFSLVISHKNNNILLPEFYGWQKRNTPSL
jgi:hypothetical protein